MQIVLVGFEPGDVPEAGLLAGLPAGADPVVRSRLWYGVVEQLGLHYTFDYSVTYTDAAWEDSFFGALAALSTPAPPTRSTRTPTTTTRRNVLDVSDNHFIDAPSVEHWLAGHAPAGVDTTRNTVFLINWWGRPDFELHVYTKTGEPDPDTGYDFGVNRDSRKIIALGRHDRPTTRRPASARPRASGSSTCRPGPEAWSGSYDVDNADLDGDGMDDYRIPPIWEYGRLPGRVGADGRPGQGRPATSRSTCSSPRRRSIRRACRPAAAADDQPRPQHVRGLAGRRRHGAVREARAARQRAAGGRARSRSRRTARTCLHRPRPQLHSRPGRRGRLLPVARLSARREPVRLQRPQDQPPARSRPGTTRLRSSTTSTPARSGHARAAGLRGRQLGRRHPELRVQLHQRGRRGVGLRPDHDRRSTSTATTRCSSHPHDGWDSASGVDYGPTGDFFFAWAGDEVNSMMSYIDVNWDFSQFDRDNGSKFKAAAYISQRERRGRDDRRVAQGQAGGATTSPRPTR